MDKSAAHHSRNLIVSDLTLERGGDPLLTNLSFSVGSGEALLLRGPNGAGKTSLLLCLAGILQKTSGSIDWQGRDKDDKPNADLHFIGHKPAIKPGLSAAENLGFWASTCGADGANVLLALDAAGLAHAAAFDAGYLSAGQTRRLSLARLIAAPRPIWLLDEPTSALDTKGDAWVCRLIDDHCKAGGMVIAATHLDLNIKAKQHELNLESKL